ncbi:MAG: hypothetical protein ABIH23_09865, partial [bacterium]
MRTWRLVGLVVCAALVTLLIILLDGDQPLDTPVNEVKVGANSGTVRFMNKTIGPGDQIAANADQSVTRLEISPTPHASPTEMPTSTPTAIPAGVLAVRLVDALGDPIPNGVIEFASQTYESASSEFLIRNVTEGVYS